jgi:hypothetical protein
VGSYAPAGVLVSKKPFRFLGNGRRVIERFRA